MTEEERQHVVKLLRESSDGLLALVGPMTDAQWTYREQDGRWSVGEIVEHLGVVERNLFNQVKGALEEPANQNWSEATAGKTELIERQLLDRSQAREAPKSSRPTGTVSRADALQRYRDRRETSLAFAMETTAALGEHTRDHFRPVYGTLNAYQWLLFIPLHNLRHNQQIAEVASSSGFETLRLDG